MAYRGSVCSHVGWLTKLSLTLTLALIFAQSGTEGIPFFPRLVDCGPPNMYPEYCVHGNFSMNFNPEYCVPRTLCYKGIDEPCQKYGDTSDCKPGLICSCDRCSTTVNFCGNLPKMPTWSEYAKLMQSSAQKYGF
ncbi:uncharacterized protein LOC129253417 [Anastrepha obliqua]|uniref:uncharacterized protein LOC129253417 n=1 Tax=Anastrepha obliqua TaxID=95512 RepID=UPI00240A44C8|nr:uncharacterized protein LOC129253417 [Anastrepha obliqua]